MYGHRLRAEEMRCAMRVTRQQILAAENAELALMLPVAISLNSS